MQIQLLMMAVAQPSAVINRGGLASAQRVEQTWTAKRCKGRQEKQEAAPPGPCGGG
jgi:hypothetical protein